MPKQPTKVKYATPRYMQIWFKYNAAISNARGLKYQILVVYNSQKGAYSLIKKQGEKIWRDHQSTIYPGPLPLNDVKGIFELFKRSAQKMDRKARFRERVGHPKL